jgi:hypothetical protein
MRKERMDRMTKEIGAFDEFFLAPYEAHGDEIDPHSGLWIYFKHACDNLPVERLSLLMLYHLADPDLVTYSPAPNQGCFSSTPAFVQEFGSPSRCGTGSTAGPDLREWFFSTVECGTWLSLVEASANNLN